MFSFPTSLFQHLILYGPRRREVPWRLVVFQLGCDQAPAPCGAVAALAAVAFEAVAGVGGFQNLPLLMVEPFYYLGTPISDGRETSTYVENGNEDIEELDAEVAPKQPREEERPSGYVFLAEFEVLICIDMHWLIAWTTRNPCLDCIKTFERQLELYRVKWFPCDCWGPPPLPLYKMPADERSPGRAGMGSMCGSTSYSNVFTWIKKRPFQLPVSEIFFLCESRIVHDHSG